ncbi:TetR/AcrR family transcriptional regulator [Phytoactinopolyspora halotolerans]|uniref:TetR/AcrR family transcriptional regulator n=1 Tax=Phytoactinopolyspora halotolerans TaxID=1981512 RepID=A0A6L9S3K9_9ACTN|nr:TetR/AcrR family transcriptional regulator [Phytoactinopolyspora halotolerans]NED98549.1 TetR/AcrR family transcriptional regulator [Phytoactinopolyspora halotolerans]
MPAQNSSPSHSQGPRRSPTSHQAIVSAAVELAGELPYSRLSIEAIAARAGVGKQTIYRWWPSKAAVVLDAVLTWSQGDDGDLQLPDTGDLETDLRAVLHATVDELNDPHYDRPMRSLTVAIVEDAQLAAEYGERLERPLHQAKKARLHRAQLAGELDPEADLDVAVEMIFGPIMNRWMTRSGPLTHAYADAVLATALAGLRRRG